MKYAIIFATICLLAACGPNPEKTSNDSTDSSGFSIETTYTMSGCFLHTDGLKNQDTTLVQLEIKDSDVTGQLSYMPHEKDRATGIMHGKKDGDIINAMWVYIQEGIKDSVAVSFKINEETILQKQPSYDSKTGRIFLADTALYSIKYTEVECK